MEIVTEKVITNAEALEILEKRSKEGEMTYEQKKALDILRKFSKIDVKKAKELFEELKSIEKLKDRDIVKIINLLPEDKDDLRVVLHKDYSIFSEEEINKILEIVKKFA